MKTATLSYGGKDYELPVIAGSEDEHAIDVSELRKQTMAVTLESADDGRAIWRRFRELVEDKIGAEDRGVPATTGP